jgi:hypothetical protein
MCFYPILADAEAFSVTRRSVNYVKKGLESGSVSIAKGELNSFKFKELPRPIYNVISSHAKLV